MRRFIAFVLCVGVFLVFPLLRPSRFAIGMFGEDPEEWPEVPTTSIAGDANGDQVLDLSDAIYLLRHLYSEGPAPVALAMESDFEARLSWVETLVSDLEDQRALDADRWRELDLGRILLILDHLVIPLEQPTDGPRTRRIIAIRDADFWVMDGRIRASGEQTAE